LNKENEESMNEKGISLIEVMVGIGISSVVILGITQMISNSQKELKKLSMATELSNFVSGISMTLENDVACKAALGGQSYDPDIDSNPIEIDGVKANVTSQKLSGWTIEKFEIGRAQYTQLVTVEHSFKNLHRAELMLKLKRTDSSLGMGSKTVMVPIRLVTLPTDPKKIAECTAEANLSAVTCSALGGVFADGVCSEGSDGTLTKIKLAASEEGAKQACGSMGGNYTGDYPNGSCMFTVEGEQYNLPDYVKKISKGAQQYNYGSCTATGTSFNGWTLPHKMNMVVCSITFHPCTVTLTRNGITTEPTTVLTGSCTPKRTHNCDSVSGSIPSIPASCTAENIPINAQN